MGKEGARVFRRDGENMAERKEEEVIRETDIRENKEGVLLRRRDRASEQAKRGIDKKQSNFFFLLLTNMHDCQLTVCSS